MHIVCSFAFAFALIREYKHSSLFALWAGATEIAFLLALLHGAGATE
jgi:hypothetical protein